MKASAGTHPAASVFSSDEVIYGSNFDVFQEVIVEDEVQEINVENSRSNSPISITNDSYSNENSVSSSYTASETHQNKYWTREDLTPSEVPPENFFENDEESKSFKLDAMDVDPTINLSDETGFAFNSLFPIKEEPCDMESFDKPSEVNTVTPACSSSTAVEPTVKKVRRRIKQEAAEAPAPTRFETFFYCQLYLKIVHVSLYACRRLHFMSLYEEEMLLRQLRPGAEKNTLNAEQRRLYRKLSLRNTKRSVGQAPFNFDRLVAKLSGKEWSEPNVSDSPLKVIGVSNVLDRFQKGCFQGSVAQSRLNMSFHRRLFGNDDDYIPEPFVSPYTGRYTFFYIFFNYIQMLMSHYVDLGH